MALSKITTNSITDDAVTNAKVADDAVNTAQIANDAVTTAKVNPAQTDITSVGTLTSFASTGIDDNADATAVTISSDEDVSLGAGDLTVSRNEANGTVRLTLSNTGSNGSTEYSELKLNSTAGGTQTSVVQHRNNYGLNIGTTTNHAVYFLQNNASAIAIDTNANVGIGTASPSDHLHVKGFLQVEGKSGDGNYIRFDNSANSGNIWRIGPGV